MCFGVVGSFKVLVTLKSGWQRSSLIWMGEENKTWCCGFTFPKGLYLTSSGGGGNETLLFVLRIRCIVQPHQNNNKC